MDENFLLQKKRAMKLLELMRKKRKSWTSIFFLQSMPSAGSHEELIELGVTSAFGWAWSHRARNTQN